LREKDIDDDESDEALEGKNIVFCININIDDDEEYKKTL